MANIAKATSAFARVLATAKSAVRKLKQCYVAYDAGTFQIADIPARKGATPFRIDTGEAYNMLIRSTDFIIGEEQFRDPSTGEAFVPLPGHRIRYTQDQVTYTFEVLPFNDEDCYRPTDSTGSEYRLHTKQINSELA